MNALSCLACRHTFQQLAHREEEHHHRALCRLPNRHCANRGEADQHVDAEWIAQSRTHQGFFRQGPHAQHGRGNVTPFCQSRLNETEQPGQGQQNAGRDHQFALVRLIPGFARFSGVTVTVRVSRASLGSMTVTRVIVFLITLVVRGHHTARNEGRDIPELPEVVLQCGAGRLCFVEFQGEGLFGETGFHACGAGQVVDYLLNLGNAGSAVHTVYEVGQGGGAFSHTHHTIPEQLLRY